MSDNSSLSPISPRRVVEPLVAASSRSRRRVTQVVAVSTGLRDLLALGTSFDPPGRVEFELDDRARARDRGALAGEVELVECLLSRAAKEEHGSHGEDGTERPGSEHACCPRHRYAAPQAPQWTAPTRRGSSQRAQGAITSRPQPSQCSFSRTV